jgi:CO/xanthine dehydrogenase FAD-binding subunit
VLGRVIVAGASGQLRNKATTGGNLRQRAKNNQLSTIPVRTSLPHGVTANWFQP